MESSDAEAYERSLNLLHRCLTPSGFIASPVLVDNYARVWARDGVITGLAALASGETELIAGMRQTLTTLARHQGPHGEIPSNVTLDSSQSSYGQLVGRVDALLWYVIGVCAYIQHTGEASYKAFALPTVERALFLAACWEYNNRGLIYTPLSGNWADEYIQHGYVLSDQLLHLMALHNAALVFNHVEWEEQATFLRQLLAVNYWPVASLCDDPLVYHPYAYRYQTTGQHTNEHWLPAFSPAGYATYFDGLAHALTLLTGLGDKEQHQRADAYVQALEQGSGSALLPAFWPVIEPGDANWAELQSNHLYGSMKNQPYRYHNGGLWPVLTGLYAVGLVRENERERAMHILKALNAANMRGSADEQWEFSEYLHGQTLAPMGTKYMAWSAAACVLASQAVWQALSPLPM
jgi:Alkaline and neutral invertase